MKQKQCATQKINKAEGDSLKKLLQGIIKKKREGINSRFGADERDHHYRRNRCFKNHKSFTWKCKGLRNN